MKKRGLSTIVSTLLILLLVFVAVGILWVVVRNVVQGGSEQISLGKFTLDMKIDQVQISESLNQVSVKVKRNSGEGEFVAMKFIFSDGENTEIFTVNSSLKVNEKKTYTFDLVDINVSNLESVSVAPVFLLSSGKESIGDIKSTWEKGSEGITFVEEENNVGAECTVDSNCTADYNSTNHCSGNSVYVTFHNLSCGSLGTCEDSASEILIQVCNSTQTCTSGSCVDVDLICTGSSTQSCTITYGVGQQTRICTSGVWSSWGTCTVVNCNSGYVISGNTCVAQISGSAESSLLAGVPIIHAQTFVIPENSVNGDTVGDLNLMWKGPSQVVTFSLTNNDGGRFSVNSNGRISVASANFDYDSQSQRQLTVRATETSTGKYNDAVITILLSRTEDTIFIDPTYSGTETGSRSQPYNSWNDITFQPSKVYLQKRGTKYNGYFSVNQDGTSSQHLIVGVYGVGTRAELDCSAYSDYQGIFLGSGYNHDGSDAAHYVDIYSFIVHGCNGIRDSYESSNVIIRDVEIYNNGDNGGIYLWGDVENRIPPRNFSILLEDIYTHDNTNIHGLKMEVGGVTMRNILTHGNGGHGISFPLWSAFNDIEYIIAYGNEAGGVEIGSAHTTLQHVLTYQNYYGVEIDEDSNQDVNVSYVVSHDNSAFGFLIWQSSGDGIVVENSEIYGNGYSGIRLRDATHGITLRNNDVYENDGSGISTGIYDSGYPTNVVISGNNIYNNKENGIKLEYGNTFLITNNIIYGNTLTPPIQIGSSVTGVTQSGNQVS